MLGLPGSGAAVVGLLAAGSIPLGLAVVAAAAVVAVAVIIYLIVNSKPPKTFNLAFEIQGADTDRPCLIVYENDNSSEIIPQAPQRPIPNRLPLPRVKFRDQFKSAYDFLYLGGWDPVMNAGGDETVNAGSRGTKLLFCRVPDGAAARPTSATVYCVPMHFTNGGPLRAESNTDLRDVPLGQVIKIRYRRNGAQWAFDRFEVESFNLTQPVSPIEVQVKAFRDAVSAFCKQKGICDIELSPDGCP